MDRSEIIRQADDIINNARARQHGDAHSSFKAVAKLWSEICGREVGAHEVCLMMIALKIMRAVNTPDHADHWRDIIGYAALGAEISEAHD
jgi:hypothetical protein